MKWTECFRNFFYFQQLFSINKLINFLIEENIQRQNKYYDLKPVNLVTCK